MDLFSAELSGLVCVLCVCIHLQLKEKQLMGSVLDKEVREKTQSKEERWGWLASRTAIIFYGL